MENLNLQNTLEFAGFRLCGSRYFAKKNKVIRISDTTDWDYAAPFSQESRNFLTALGLCRKFGDPAYYDDNSAEIWFLPRGNVEVVLKYDIDLHKRVFERVDPIFYWKYLWKSNPDKKIDRNDILAIVNALLAVARDG